MTQENVDLAIRDEVCLIWGEWVGMDPQLDQTERDQRIEQEAARLNADGRGSGRGQWTRIPARSVAGRESGGDTGLPDGGLPDGHRVGVGTLESAGGGAVSAGVTEEA